MNKITLITIMLLIRGICYCQTNSNEILEPIAFTRACLEAAKIPNSDTLECYPEGTKKWLVLIEEYKATLSKKLNLNSRKVLESDTQEWLKLMEEEIIVTNQIIQDKNLPLVTRRQAAIRQFKFAEKRALSLRKTILEYK